MLAPEAALPEPRKRVSAQGDCPSRERGVPNVFLTTPEFYQPSAAPHCSELLSFRVSTLERGASRNEEKLGTRLGPAEFRGDRTSTRQLQCKEPGPGFFPVQFRT